MSKEKITVDDMLDCVWAVEEKNENGFYVPYCKQCELPCDTVLKCRPDECDLMREGKE